MADPSAYDEVQDGRLDALEGLVQTNYVPPTGAEYSFPAERMPISQSQFSLLSLPAGDGVIDRGGYPYNLTVENVNNTGTLSVDQNTGKAEAIVAGFFHVLTQPLTVPLPAVTTATTYYVCLTYDPRKLGDQGTDDTDPQGPVSVQVYAGTPPTDQGRIHVVLMTVARTANQLLTDATITTVRPRICPTIYVNSADQLPDPTKILFGTLGVVRATNELYTVALSGSTQAWRNLTSPDWIDSTSTTHVWAGHGARPGYRVIGDRVEYRGHVKRSSGDAYNTYSDTNAYTVIPNSPISTATPLLGGATSGAGPLRWRGSTTAAPACAPLTGTATWMDLTGYSYYWK